MDERDRSPHAGRAVSMADVARLAGVSGQTVSRVLNGLSPVHEDTRVRVEGAIRALGYRPNAAARSLRTGSTGNIGVVFRGFAAPETQATMEAIAFEAASRGLMTTIVPVAVFDTPSVRAAIDSLAPRVDGFVLLTDAFVEISTVAGRPLVIFGAAPAGPDLVSAVRDAVGKLIPSA